MLRRLLLTVAFTSAQLHPASSQEADAIYARGTDIGAEYINEHAPRLWLSLRLQECGERETSNEVGRGLPNTVQYAVAKQGLPNDADAIFVAQVTRAYVLGYEIGVRLEFRRLSDAEKNKACDELRDLFK